MIIAIVLSIVLCDRITKFLALKHLVLHQPVEIIQNIFSFTLVHNRGAAFGILRDQVPFFIFASVLAIIIILLYFKRCAFWDKIALSLILAGAAGNLYDRIVYGYVVDFLDFKVFPVFNIADSAISIGGVLIAFSILRLSYMDMKQKNGNKKKKIKRRREGNPRCRKFSLYQNRNAKSNHKDPCAE